MIDPIGTPPHRAELGSSASSAALRNFPAELDLPKHSNGFAKFRKFRKRALRNWLAELQNIPPDQSVRQVPQVPQNATPYGGCACAPQRRAHTIPRAVGFGLGLPPMGTIPASRAATASSAKNRAVAALTTTSSCRRPPWHP